MRSNRQPLRVDIDSAALNRQHPVRDLSNVYFPCEPYPQQVAIVETLHKVLRKGQNALVDSPTGTGKTLSLLVGVLSFFADSQAPCKVFYLTRTHSQINQVVAELGRTCYKVRTSIVSAKESLCINQEMRDLKGRELDRRCERECRRNRCPYREWDGDVQLPPTDIPHLREAGRVGKFCPYFQQRVAEPESEVVIMPYNYLFDLQLLKANRFDIGGSVILVDEAHNIDQHAQEGCSFSITDRNVREALRELDVFQRATKPSQPNSQWFKRPLKTLQGRMKELAEGVTHLDSFEDLFEVLKSMTKEEKSADSYSQGLNAHNLNGYLDLGAKIVMHIPSSPALDAYLSFLRKCLSTCLNEQPSSFSIYSQRTSEQSIINITCLTSSLVFRHLASMGPRSIILASGTLQPLRFWPQETGLQFPFTLSNESFIEQKHAYGCVIPNYRGQDFDFSYLRRANSKQIECLLDLINLIGKNTPNGVVVVFSSYEVYDMVMAALPQDGLCKPLFCESREAKAQSLLASYAKMSSSASGAFLFTVMRGKFSEGIDFRDEMCRAMLVVGVPFPPQTVEMLDKQRYIDAIPNRVMDSREWYLTQGTKAVSQALGRAIRHQADYGGVFLIDKRYASRSQLKGAMPSWFCRVDAGEFNLHTYRAFFKNKTSHKDGAGKMETEQQHQLKPKRRLLLSLEPALGGEDRESQTLRKPMESTIQEAETLLRPRPKIQDL